MILKKALHSWKNELNSEAGNIVVQVKIDNHIYEILKKSAFITIKDVKENFRINLECSF